MISSKGHLLGERGDRHVDLRARPIDRLPEIVEVGQELADQKRVVRAEPPQVSGDTSAWGPPLERDLGANARGVTRRFAGAHRASAGLGGRAGKQLEAGDRRR
jgi:hypothetical protein